MNANSKAEFRICAPEVEVLNYCTNSIFFIADFEKGIVNRNGAVYNFKRDINIPLAGGMFLLKSPNKECIYGEDINC